MTRRTAPAQPTLFGDVEPGSVALGPLTVTRHCAATGETWVEVNLWAATDAPEPSRLELPDLSDLPSDIRAAIRSHGDAYAAGSAS